ncbi:MAG: hypothetical protein EOO41_05455 [Methanobacteriota archaeon]|nr:MAG: hypothetical protein EOO41_05455 [Euryarchaeota archaeon]
MAVVSGEAGSHAGAAAGEGGEVAEAALGGGAATMGAPARVTPGRGAASGDWQAASSRRAERNEAANARDKRERLALEKRMLVAEKVAEDEKAARYV